MIRRLYVLLPILACFCLAPQEATARPPRTYQIAIETVPPGAAVYVDDKSKGPIGYTPFKPRIKQGTHTLFIELEGYEPQTQTLIIDRSSYKKTFSYTLIKAVLNPTLEVRARSGDTSADGASVSVDGADWGILPVSKQVPIGRHLVKIEKTDFLPYSEWVDLKEGEVRTISASLEPVLKAASLQVEGTPGAQVYLDGILKGNIPALIENISPGRHFIKVTKEGFENFEQWSEFTGGVAQTINATLTAAAPKILLGTIKVFSDQDPADVYLDGELKGVSPLPLEGISPGEHFLEVRKEGFQKYEQIIKVESGQSAVVKVTMISSGPKAGVVRIISPEVEAQVYIDGNLAGPVPVVKEDLIQGEHFITVKKAGFKDWEKKISIGPDTPPMELVAELVASGTVKILTNLEGAEIFLDGEKLDQTSPPEGVPLELKDISVGEHAVLVRLDKYKEFQETFSVTAGETKLVQVTLMKLGPSAEELVLRRRTISTYSARVIPPGNLAIDIMAGLPYFAEVHFSTGLQLNNTIEDALPIDVGVDVKIAGTINEIYARGKYQLVNSPVFGLAAEGSIGGGLGLAKTAGATSFSANSFDITATGIASLFFRDILTVSGRAGFHVYTDGSSGDLFVAGLAPGKTRDSGARLIVGLATQIHSKKTPGLSYNILFHGNPGGIGSGLDVNGVPRRLMYSLALPFSDPLLYAQVGVSLKF